MNDMLKLGLRLFIITAVAALALGLTNLATEGPIQNQKLSADNEARLAVLPGADGFDKIQIDENYKSDGKTEIEEIFEGKNGNNALGYTFKLSTKGFGGAMELMVGIKQDGTIGGINIGSHSETPGLGAKAKDKSFTDQYDGKSAAKHIKVVKSSPKDNEVQAITGATVTSKAVTSAVNISIDYFNNVLKDGGGVE